MGKTYIADKATLDACYSILSADAIFGFIEHNAILARDSRIEYTGANKAYTPITVNKTTGEADYGSWADFPWLKGNVPYMVKSDGTPDYKLDPDDYTKKEDGTDSDIANTEYDGGAFAWAPKIYKQEYMAGNDRIVNFSMTKRDGFEAVGFTDGDENELEGVWIPMFYGSTVTLNETDRMTSLSGLQPDYSKSTAQQKTVIDAFGTRARFFGGPIVETLIDLMIMFGKSPDTQAVFGSGNCSGYDSTKSPTMGVLENAVVAGGQFYGTSTGKALNKIFHSIVLGTYQQYMRDPYLLLVNGRYKVSKNYEYDVTGATYTDTGISLAKITKADGTQNTGIFYPHKFHTIPGFGAVPVEPYKGSTSTGGCDGLYQNVETTAVSFRFGGCDNGTIDGARYFNLDGPAGVAAWSIGAALLLLPPAGVTA